MEDQDVVVLNVEKHEWEDEKQKRKQNNRRKMFISIAIVIGLIISFVVGYSLSNMSLMISDSQDKYQYIKNMMRYNWYFSKDYPNIDQQLEDKTIKGITSFENDPHTEYLNRETYTRMMSSLQGKIYGIGIRYSKIADHYIVAETIKNSPASQAGIEVNDRIVKVNGQEIKNKTLEEASNLVRGERGTTVELTILRNNQEKTITIQRQEIATTLDYSIIDNVGIIHLNSFTENGGEEMDRAFADLQSKGVKKIIIDMRNNGGGYVNTAKKIAELMLPKNSILLQQEDVNRKRTQLRTSVDPKYKFEKYVVLINGQSASASEALTAALREQMPVTVVGTKSYGKGTVQTVHPFGDGTALKYTIAQWLTPKGNIINKVGITPDHIVDSEEALTTTEGFIPFDNTIKENTVNAATALAQKSLNFINDSSLRVDGYFDVETKKAIETYQQTHKLPVTGELSYDLLVKLRVAVKEKDNLNPTKYDKQLKKALEVINE